MADKNKYGQYFTIDLIAEFMVNLISKQKDSRVLEPSCGKGVFLKYLIKSGFTNISAYEIDNKLKSDYKFIKYKSFLSVPTDEKYDIVIGNPPYIRWKNIEPELKIELENNSLWNKYFNSLCDYLFIFILKSIEHLNENGELIFICTEYWLNTTHSESLRNYMCRNGYFTEIYHFKEAPLFEGVTASFIIFKYIKKKRHEATSIKFYNFNKTKGLPSKEELNKRDCFDYIEIPHFQENSRWILATKEEQEKLNKFELSCKKNSTQLFTTELYKLEEFCDIGNGMVSGLDAVFQYSDIESLNDEERTKIIKVMKAKNLMPYKNNGITHYIFIQENISEELFEKKYPNFAMHFKQHLEKLSKRYSYNRKIPYWEFVFPRNQKLFERNEPRIFVPCKERISSKDYFRFCYAPKECFPTQDVTAIFKKNNIKESLEYILAYLNNNRVFNWLKLNGIVKGAIVEFSETPLANIPFRPINWKSQKEIYLHDKITQEVHCYLEDSLYLHIENINTSFNELFYV